MSDALVLLLQAVPRGLDLAAAESGIHALPGVAEVGHFRAWTLTDDSTVATVHVTPAPGTDPLALPAQVAGYLRREHAIGHATVQVDAPGHIEAPAH